MITRTTYRGAASTNRTSAGRALEGGARLIHIQHLRDLTCFTISDRRAPRVPSAHTLPHHTQHPVHASTCEFRVPDDRYHKRRVPIRFLCRRPLLWRDEMDPFSLAGVYPLSRATFHRDTLHAIPLISHASRSSRLMQQPTPSQSRWVFRMILAVCQVARAHASSCRIQCAWASVECVQQAQGARAVSTGSLVRLPPGS